MTDPKATMSVFFCYQFVPLYTLSSFCVCEQVPCYWKTCSRSTIPASTWYRKPLQRYELHSEQYFNIQQGVVDIYSIFNSSWGMECIVGIYFDPWPCRSGTQPWGKDQVVASIAFPAIGTGVLGHPVDFTASIMLEEVIRFHYHHPSFSLRVSLVLLEKAKYDKRIIKFNHAKIKVI